MKAISLLPEWAMAVTLGFKTVECRTWSTPHRGDLLICSSAKPVAGAIAGHAMCVARLDRIEPFERRHLRASMMGGMPERGSYAWRLSDVRLIEPFAVKGRLHLYDVPDDLVKPLSCGAAEGLRRYYEPLVKWSDRRNDEKAVREWWECALAGL